MILGLQWGLQGGAVVELTVSAMEATVSVIEARSSVSTSTGANFEEPWIAAEAEGRAVLELTVLSMKAWAVARESSSAAALPLGLCPMSKETNDRSCLSTNGGLVDIICLH